MSSAPPCWSPRCSSWSPTSWSTYFRPSWIPESPSSDHPPNGSHLTPAPPSRRVMSLQVRNSRPSVRPSRADLGRVLHALPGCHDGLVSVDVRVERVIERPVSIVAGFAGDPSNAPAWYANIKSMRWHTQPPLRVGSLMDFVARFIGREL